MRDLRPSIVELSLQLLHLALAHDELRAVLSRHLLNLVLLLLAARSVLLVELGFFIRLDTVFCLIGSIPCDQLFQLSLENSVRLDLILIPLE